MSENRDVEELALLFGGESGPPATLIITAHPDDAVVGLGAQLARLGPRAHVLQVTDGVPRETREAHAREFAAHAACADARRRELLQALALAGIGSGRTSVFGIADQEASLDLSGLVRRVAELLTWLRPKYVLAPAYEGGHPDHDAVAFAAWAARSVLRRAGMRVPLTVEFPLYHGADDGAVVAGRFLPGGPPALVLTLDEDQRLLKRRMLERFTEQPQAGLALDVERFRCSPDRDFREAPHGGALHYERLGGGMTGVRWRCLAGEALSELELLPSAAIPA